MIDGASPEVGASAAGQEPGHRHSGALRFLMKSAAALASTSLVTSALGFLYWVVAARTFSPVAVGESSTAISAMSLLAPFTVLGLGTLLISELPELQTGRARLVSTGLVVCATVGALLALVCAFVLPQGFLGVYGIGHEFGRTLLFCAAVATQGAGMFLDQALLSMVGGGMQLWRNLTQSLVKLFLLGVFAITLAQYSSLTIFSSWLVANIVSLAVMGAVLIRRFGVPLRDLTPSLSALHGLKFTAFKHHSLNMTLFVPFFAMPMVANAILGPERSGFFFAAWSLSGFVMFLPFSLATALFASGSRDSESFLPGFRHTLRYALLICLAATLGMMLLGKVALGIFGPDYVSNAYHALVAVCIGCLGLVIKDHHVALARINGTVGREARLIGVLSGLEIAAAGVGAHLGGITGMGIGWMSAALLGALVCGPLVRRTYRSAPGSG